MQLAGHLSLEFDAAVEGPFDVGDEKSAVRVWFSNKRGLSLLSRKGTVELITVRETVPVRGKTYDGTPWRADYGTPVKNGGILPDVTLDKAREAAATVRGLPKIDPRDQRPTYRPS